MVVAMMWRRRLLALAVLPALAWAVSSRSTLAGVVLRDPGMLPGYRVLATIEFSDGFKHHVVHDAVGPAGRRLVVVGQMTPREWVVADDQVVDPPTAAIFTGTDIGGAVKCAVNGNRAIALGYLLPDEGGRLVADGEQLRAYTLDTHSQITPLPYRVECSRSVTRR